MNHKLFEAKQKPRCIKKHHSLHIQLYVQFNQDFINDNDKEKHLLVIIFKTTFETKAKKEQSILNQKRYIYENLLFFIFSFFNLT